MPLLKALCTPTSLQRPSSVAIRGPGAPRGSPVCAGKGFSTEEPKTAPPPPAKRSPLQQTVSADKVKAMMRSSQPPAAAAPQKEAELAPGGCPCCSGRMYEACCAPYHTAGGPSPGTPEATLRARFSAYVKGLPDFLLSTTHPDFLGFHYGHDTQETVARAQLATDTQAACVGWQYKGLKIAPQEAAPTRKRVNHPSPRGGSRRAQQQEEDGEATLKYTYRVLPPPLAEATSTPDWESFVEETTFRKVGGEAGTWQMSGYKHRLGYSDANPAVAQMSASKQEALREANARVAKRDAGVLAAQLEKEAVTAAARPEETLPSGAVRVQPRDWKLDPSKRSATAAPVLPAA